MCTLADLSLYINFKKNFYINFMLLQNAGASRAATETEPNRNNGVNQDASSGGTSANM
jgi:hypothetical protein